MGVAKEHAIEIDHSHAAALDLVEAAYKKMGYRQYSAISKHAGKHSEEHIAQMLSLMEHTLREAHKLAMKEVGA